MVLHKSLSIIQFIQGVLLAGNNLLAFSHIQVRILFVSCLRIKNFCFLRTAKHLSFASVDPFEKSF